MFKRTNEDGSVTVTVVEGAKMVDGKLRWMTRELTIPANVAKHVIFGDEDILGPDPDQPESGQP